VLIFLSRFKSTQELEVKFKARRLSKNFLGLLESLLHVIPSVRPSSERVLMGIDEGKVGWHLVFKYHSPYTLPSLA
jgi:hypothetical protein